MFRSSLRLVALVLTLGAGLALSSSLWSPAGALPPPDTAYTAVAPCVVFDSRASQGATGGFVGPLNGNQGIAYDVTGAFFPAQGGNAPGGTCGIPDGADAVEINIVAVNALNEGNLRVTDGTPSSTGGVVNYNNLTPKLNTSNSVIIPLNALGELVVTPNCGTGCTTDTTDVRGVVLGYFTDSLATKVATLQTDVTALKNLLADVTRIPDAGVGAVGGKDTLRFTGMNVQIVDGTNSTACNDSTPGGFDSACNGQGNLIIGYAENPLGLQRGGSHNIIGGTENGWRSYGGLVVGHRNQISNDFASVSAGTNNAAEGPFSTVSGGSSHEATGDRSSISGGMNSTASGVGSSVSGGSEQIASGETSSVSGGFRNNALELRSTVSGGGGNEADEEMASVSGGLDNHANGFGSSVVGGEFNFASGESSVVVGGGGFGGGNVATGDHAVVAAGRNNEAAGTYSSVSGGQDNLAAPGTNCIDAVDASVVAGGRWNVASGCQATVLGGGDDEAENGNLASGPWATVSGGHSNVASGTRSAVSGGSENTATGNNAAIGGGNGETLAGANDWQAGPLIQPD